MSDSRFHNPSAGTAKLVQDLLKLLNSRQGSDVEFKVGGGVTDEIHNSTIYDASVAETIHAHSAILRCRSQHFETIFENEKEWKERSGGIIHKPNILPSVFRKILDYIYTGDVHVKINNLPQLIAAAEEMDLEELSLQCQAKVIRVLGQSFSKDERVDDRSDDEYLPFEVAVREILIPTLILAHHNTMTDFFQQLFNFTVVHIEPILSLSSTRTAFFTKIPTPVFQQILTSDELAMPEYSIWEFAFNLACHKANVVESAVKAYFKLESTADDVPDEVNIKIEPQEDGTALLSDQQLMQLKANLSPLLPAVRFSLIEGEQYSRIVDILYHFLHARRSVELQKFHAQPDKMRILDSPRLKRKREPEEDPKMVSYIIDKPESWQQLKTWIFESNGIAGCLSAEDVQFDLLFRASKHEFLAKAFHEHSDNKGPTLVIVKSNDGHLFGGINFSSWESNEEHSGTTSNFLFALADGIHRRLSAKFSYNQKEGAHPAFNTPEGGPVFGYTEGFYSDLDISDKANTLHSYSCLVFYNGVSALSDALAGKNAFLIAEYEVFAISKIQ